MATYEITAVGRTPQQLTSPTLVEQGRLVGGFGLTETLNDAGELSMEVNMGTLTSDIKNRLVDLKQFPLEIWVYRDGVAIFKGPLVGGNISGDSVSMTARGGLFYTQYMLVETNKTFVAVDEFLIAETLINDWQDQDYGNFGVNTVGIGTSGTTSDLDIAGATEQPTVYESLMGFAEGRFDVWVDPTDSQLYFGTKGVDLSATVFLERGIHSATTQFSVAPGLVASEVFATGTGPNIDPALTATKVNTTTRQEFGRSGHGVTIDQIGDATDLSNKAQAAVDDRAEMYFKPGPGMVPVPGADWDDFESGDTVTYTFDAGLGQQTGPYRVYKRTLTVSDNGQEQISVEFV
jgi:hypothetical protein